MVKSFVIDFNDVMIVPTVINLAHILGLRVVAEGIKKQGSVGQACCPGM